MSNNVDTSRLEAWKEQQAKSGGGSTSGGGGPTSGGMEPRVKALEDKFEKIDGKLTSIQADLARIGAKVDHLPTAFNVVQITGILFALLIAGIGGTLAILKYVVAP